MIFVIIVTVLALIGLVIGGNIPRTSYHKPTGGDYIFGMGAGLVIGGLIGLIFGMLICGGSSDASSEDRPYTNVKEYELVALATQQETEGSAGMLIFVGWGNVGEERKAYWTAKDEDGIAQMYSENALDILVKETNTTPRYVIQEKIDDSGFWFPWDMSSDRREFLEVPEGTLTANYEFQP